LEFCLEGNKSIEDIKTLKDVTEYLTEYQSDQVRALKEKADILTYHNTAFITNIERVRTPC